MARNSSWWQKLANHFSRKHTRKQGRGRTFDILEDRVVLNNTLDFGDAPDAPGGPQTGSPYPTLLAHDGARHIIVPGFSLGPTLDPEGDGQPNATATGDDIAGLIPDDEDGVSIGPLVAGGVTPVGVTASAPGKLDAWVDFNDDGDWADLGEQIFDDFPLVAGLNSLSFFVPGTAAVTPQTFSRWRFSSAGVLSYAGLAPDGEVEDYQAAITPFCEHFDLVTAPALPTGWASQAATGSQAWTTSTTMPFSAPNDAFLTDASFDTDTRLVSPTFTYNTSYDQLAFRNFYQTEAGYDFATLDISINGGPFTDILSAGGSFVTGGYDDISGWTGSSGGYIPTVVSLPAAGLGLPVQLRWRLTTDSSVGAPGWRIDDVCLQSPPTDDFGDAPDSFGTLLASGGPHHNPVGPRLGTLRDIESDANPPLNGTGDDVDGVDDEDGITLGLLIPGNAGTATVNVQVASGFLNAWVDFDGSGSFGPGEQIATNLAVAVANNPVPFAIPGASPLGPHIARFRLSGAPMAVPSPLGFVPDGEVEDHVVQFGVAMLCENFDLLAAPALPAGWTSQAAVGAQAWTTSTTTPFSAPNDAFLTDAAFDTDTRLISPTFTYTTGSDFLVFRNFYQTESGFDFATLDISINGGPFTDIVSAGGIFGGGGYNSGSGWTGSSGGNILTGVSLPAAGLGLPVQLRWRLTTDFTVGAPGWRIDDVCLQPPPPDFGDAPDSFGTLLASGGPSHTAVGPRLGTLRDVELDANPPLNGTGDDVVGVDDEDGVSLGLLIPGNAGTATVNVQVASGFLNAWVDFDGSGSFGPGEQAATNLAVAVGNNLVPFAIPGASLPGPHFTRFRLSSTPMAVPSPLGFVPDGEVEDYVVQFGVAMLCENFDLVTAPALPAGWSSQAGSGAQVWRSSTVTPFSAPNDAFLTDASTTTDTRLVSPLFIYTAANNQLVFRNFYNTQSGFDFASLEISINGTAFANVVTAGGVFFAGAPNGTSNRWTGNAGGYILSGVTLPASGYGQAIQLRWRLTTNSSVSAPGWRIDDICLQTDFGDAPDPTYPTLLASNGARHTMVPGYFLGAVFDGDANGQPNATATGDDIAGVPDDEDGVSFGPLTAGATGTISVVASAAGKLDAWIDFNDDGDWADPGEQIFNDAALGANTNTLTFAVPGGAVTTSPTFSRFRFSSAGVLSYTGPAPDGEVEDYQVAIQAPLDFGDAPDSTYPTLLANNGARHSIVPGVLLGAAIDAEANGQPNASATGDDAATIDDEGGVIFTSPLVPGLFASATVIASAPGKLDAWIDFNANGSWADSDEQIFVSLPLIAGPNFLTYSVPGAAALNANTFARFRFSTAGGLSFTGLAPDGEVEDYAVRIGVDTIRPTGKVNPVTGSTQLVIVFNEPVSGFGLGDVELRRDGALLAPPWPGGTNFSTPDNITFTIDNFGALLTPPGVYSVKVNATTAGIVDGSGNAMTADINSFFDVFDQVDGTLLGPSWTTTVGGFADSTNTLWATNNVTPTNVAVLAAPAPADVSVQADISLVASGYQHGGVLARYNGPADTNWYWGGLVRTPTTLAAQIYRGPVALTFTPVIIPVVGGFQTASVRFQVVGSLLNLFVNDVPVGSFNDLTSALAGGQAGIRASFNTRFNNFNVCQVPLVGTGLPYFDDFAQAPGSKLAGAWVEKAGNFNVPAGAAQGNNTYLNLAILNGVSDSDVSVQANVNVPAINGKYAGVVARYSGPDDKNMYFGTIFRDAGVFKAQIWKNVGGTWGLPVTSAVVPAGVGTLRLKVVDSTLKLFYNGIQVGSFIDPSPLATGSVGMRSSSSATLDNFVGVKVLAASASLPFADSFTQANFTDLSIFWKEQVGTFTALSNQAKAGPLAINSATLNGLGAATDVTVMADVNMSIAAGNFAGLMARYSGLPESNFYWGGLIASGGMIYARIFKRVAGVDTILATSGPLASGTGTLKFEVIGTSLKLSFTGLGTPLMVVDGSLLSGTVGISGSAGQTFDNFSAS